MEKKISLIIKGLTLVALALLVFITYNNNKTRTYNDDKTITYNSQNKEIEIYIAPSDEYYFEDMWLDGDRFKMHNSVIDVEIVVYEKNKILEMHNESLKVEVYYQNNFYYVIKMEKGE